MAAAAGVLYSHVSNQSIHWTWVESGNARDGVSTTSDGSLAGLAVPDTGGVSSDSILTTESAGVLGVLGDFHLLHLLSQGSTVSEPAVSELFIQPISKYRILVRLLSHPSNWIHRRLAKNICDRVGGF